MGKKVKHVWHDYFLFNELYELQILCYSNTQGSGGRAPLVLKYQIQATVSLRKELLLVPF
jgi:hypothetical protein